MYFITAIQSNSQQGISLSKRCFGYHPDLYSAIDDVTDNVGNMRECLYDYIVIEHISPGVHSLADNEVWFKWGENAPTGWHLLHDKPAEFEGIINFAVG